MPRPILAETRTQILYWDEDAQCVWGALRKGIGDHTAEDAEENVTAQEQARDTKGLVKTRVLVDMRDVRSMSREAREYYGNERTAQVQLATALLIDSLLTRMIANFFMGLNKPRTPTKMFTDPDAALAWLKTFPLTHV